MDRVPNQITADTSKCSGTVTIQASEQETEDLVSQFLEIFRLFQEEDDMIVYYHHPNGKDAKLIGLTGQIIVYYYKDGKERLKKFCTFPGASDWLKKNGYKPL